MPPRISRRLRLGTPTRTPRLAFLAENTILSNPAEALANKPDVVVAMVFHRVRLSLPHTDTGDRQTSLAWLRAVGCKPLQFPLPMPAEVAERYRLPVGRREGIAARMVATGRWDMKELVDMNDGELELAFHKLLPCLPDLPEDERAAHLEWLGARGMRPYEIPLSPEAAQAMGLRRETGTAPSWVDGPPTTDLSGVAKHQGRPALAASELLEGCGQRHLDARVSVELSAAATRVATNLEQRGLQRPHLATPS